MTTRSHGYVKDSQRVGRSHGRSQASVLSVLCKAITGGGGMVTQTPKWPDWAVWHGLSYVAVRNGSLSRGYLQQDSRFHDLGASLEFQDKYLFVFSMALKSKHIYYS